jgi:hypothetical protein
METCVLESQGTFQMLISRSIGESMHKHTGPGPIASILGARDLRIDGLYTLWVTDDLGSASVDDSIRITDNCLPIDRNSVERALPVTLQSIIVSVNSKLNASPCIPTCSVTGIYVKAPW